MQKEEITTRREIFSQTVKQSIQDEISKAKNSKEKGEHFLGWVITRLFDASPDEIRNQITDGPNDMGIDAWIKPDIESENGGIIQLFQCKYNESHDENEILGFVDDVKKFLKMDVEDIPRKELKVLHQLIKKENLDAELYYITDQKIDFKTHSRKLKVFGFDQIVDKLWDDVIGIPKRCGRINSS